VSDLCVGVLVGELLDELADFGMGGTAFGGQEGVRQREDGRGALQRSALPRVL
jgi:hypothetical protein